MSAKESKKVEETAVKSTKIAYPKEFNYFKQEAHVRVKPNKKNTFIISKYRKESKTLHSTTHQYVSMHEIQEAGDYRLRAYIIPTEFKPKFESNVYAEYAILALQNADDENEFLPVFCVSFEALKCAACYGSGYFKSVNKNNFASVLTQQTQAMNPLSPVIPAIGRVAKAQGGSALHSNICTYNHALGIGCGGSGIDAQAFAAYQHKITALYQFNREKMINFMRFAQTAPKKTSVFYSDEEFSFAGDKKAYKKPETTIDSFGKIEL